MDVVVKRTEAQGRDDQGLMACWTGARVPLSHSPPRSGLVFNPA